MDRTIEKDRLQDIFVGFGENLADTLGPYINPLLIFRISGTIIHMDNTYGGITYEPYRSRIQDPLSGQPDTCLTGKQRKKADPVIASWNRMFQQSHSGNLHQRA